MATTTELTGNFSKNYYVPFYWCKRVNLEDLKEYFTEIQNSSIHILDYGRNHNKEILTKRTKIVEWLQFVCKNLNFKNETVFKAIHLFDLYMSKVKRDSTSLGEIQLSAVACLNLACKLEEINCNYMSFLKEHLLDDEKNQYTYTLKDLANKETEILRVLNYKLSSPTIYQFNNVFMQIAISEIIKFYTKINAEKNNFPPLNFLIVQLINCNDIILKNYSTMKESVFTDVMSSGLICFKATILVLSYLMGVDMSFINELINRNIKVLIKDLEFLQRAEIIAFNFFTYLVNENKFSLFSELRNEQETASNSKYASRKNSNEEEKEIFVEGRKFSNNSATNSVYSNSNSKTAIY